MLKIGKTFEVEVSKISKSSNSKYSRKVGLKSIDGHRCILDQYERNCEVINQLVVGTSIEAWLYKIHKNDNGTPSLYFSILKHGRSNPNENRLKIYLDSIENVVNFLEAASINDIGEYELNYFAEIKGALSRCVRKDQSDWLYVYNSFGFEYYEQVVNVRKLYEEFYRLFRLAKKNELLDSQYLELEESLQRLKKSQFLKKIKRFQSECKSLLERLSQGVEPISNEENQQETSHNATPKDISETEKFQEVEELLLQLRSAGPKDTSKLIQSARDRLDWFYTYVQRNQQKQQAFRTEILRIYQKCLITGSTTTEILEAAHIIPHSRCHSAEQSFDIGNGLLLRTDIHKLFDSYIIGFKPVENNPIGYTVVHRDVSSSDVVLQGLLEDLKDKILEFKFANRNAMLARWKKFKAQ